MKVYIAARYDRLKEMNKHKTLLSNAGFTVTSRWLNGTHQIHPNPEKIDKDAENVDMAARPFAEDDLEDVINSDVLIFFSEPANSHSKRGGRHVEFGIALALKKRIMVVGNRENVFHCLPQIEHYKTFGELLQCL